MSMTNPIGGFNSLARSRNRLRGRKGKRRKGGYGRRFGGVSSSARGMEVPMGRKRVTVTTETDTGRNTRFHDNVTGADMSRAQFVREIERGAYENYHVREINGVKTPCSDPDKSKNNNLG